VGGSQPWRRRALAWVAVLGGALGPGMLAAHGQALDGHACPSTRDTAGFELGQATYYHPSLVNQPMANGRPYDPANPSLAASNRYRLGTVLRVTRVDRPEVIVVEVADRGSDGVELDLSEAAFARLAALSEGNIVVCIERLT
jgi:rare lipoprotein A (peptidoglycan hydrolase)